MIQSNWVKSRTRELWRQIDLIAQYPDGFHLQIVCCNLVKGEFILECCFWLHVSGWAVRREGAVSRATLPWLRAKCDSLERDRSLIKVFVSTWTSSDDSACYFAVTQRGVLDYNKTQNSLKSVKPSATCYCLHPLENLAKELLSLLGKKAQKGFCHFSGFCDVICVDWKLWGCSGQPWGAAD